MTAIEFRAPWSRGLRVITGISLAISIGVPIVVLLMTSLLPLPAVILLAGSPLMIIVAALLSRVRGYVLTERAITVQRAAWNTELPLAGLRSVAGDVEAMRGSLRLFGNGGLFSFTGEFWNRKLGRYRALVTDPDRAVVLRYARRTIVISPHDPQHFIMRARTLLQSRPTQ